MSIIPNQIKALVFYNLPFVKNLDIPLLTDIVRNITTQATVNVNYYKLVMVEIFEGYETTSDGSLDMKRPIYAPLKLEHLEKIVSPTLCRLKRFYNNALKLKRDILSFPIEDQYFFLTPSLASPIVENQSEDVMNKNIFIQHLFPRQFSIEGATTNIMSQSALVYMPPPPSPVQTVPLSPDAPMMPNPPGSTSTTPAGPTGVQAGPGGGQAYSGGGGGGMSGGGGGMSGGGGGMSGGGGGY